jgi:hypothetical protein
VLPALLADMSEETACAAAELCAWIGAHSAAAAAIVVDAGLVAPLLGLLKQPPGVAAVAALICSGARHERLVSAQLTANSVFVSTLRDQVRRPKAAEQLAACRIVAAMMAGEGDGVARNRAVVLSHHMLAAFLHCFHNVRGGDDDRRTRRGGTASDELVGVVLAGALALLRSPTLDRRDALEAVVQCDICAVPFALLTRARDDNFGVTLAPAQKLALRRGAVDMMALLLAKRAAAALGVPRKLRERNPATALAGFATGTGCDAQLAAASRSVLRALRDDGEGDSDDDDDDDA